MTVNITFTLLSTVSFFPPDVYWFIKIDEIITVKGKVFPLQGRCGTEGG